jgi:hypothetical protein
LQEPANNRSTLVIAWEHRRLPNLARGLGWGAMPDIDDGDFDSLWLLRFAASDRAPEVRVDSQTRLLAACGNGAAPGRPGLRP